MKKLAIAILALSVSAGIGYAAGTNAVPGLSSLNPKAFKYVLPDNIKWGPAAGLEGTDAYTLVGDPAKPGFYVVLNRFHPGNFSHPHYHANDRYIMVISGTWWVDTGATWDPEGPGTRHECEGPTAEKGPGPCEDARKAAAH